MAKQTITVAHFKLRTNVNGSGKNFRPNLKDSSMVNVAPHVRMVHGKPVYVAGYTYRRKA